MKNNKKLENCNNCVFPILKKASIKIPRNFSRPQGMWVLEGDEVIAINGTSCKGADLDGVVALVAGSEGDTVTLRLSRNYLKAPKVGDGTRT